MSQRLPPNGRLSSRLTRELALKSEDTLFAWPACWSVLFGVWLDAQRGGLNDRDLCWPHWEDMIPAVLGKHHHRPAGLIRDGERVPEQSKRPVREVDVYRLPR